MNRRAMISAVAVAVSCVCSTPAWALTEGFITVHHYYINWGAVVQVPAGDYSSSGYVMYPNLDEYEIKMLEGAGAEQWYTRLKTWAYYKPDGGSYEEFSSRTENGPHMASSNLPLHDHIVDPNEPPFALGTKRIYYNESGEGVTVGWFKFKLTLQENEFSSGPYSNVVTNFIYVEVKTEETSQ